MPKRKAKKNSNIKFYFIASLTVAALIIGKVIMTSMMKPADINVISATNPQPVTPNRVGVPLPTGGETCYYQDVQCIKAPCEPILVCPNPTSKPMPSGPVSTPVPKPSLVATPVPVPSVVPTKSGVASFVSKGPCGISHFLNISFSCGDGRMKELATNVCTDVYSAFKLAYSSCQSTGLEGAAK